MSLRIKLYFKIVLGFALLGILFFLIDWKAGFQLLLEAEPLYIVVAMLLYPVALGVAARRWLVLLRTHGIMLSHFEALKIYWIGVYLSNFLPSNIGGDVSRVGLLYRYGKPAQVASSVVLERLLGLVILFSLAILTTLIRPDILIWRGGTRVIWCGFLILLFVLLLLVKYMRNSIQKKRQYRFIGEKFKKVLLSICDYKEPKIFIKVLWFSLLYNFVSFTCHYFLARSINLNLTVFDIFLVTPLIFIVSMIPVTFNAIGLAESAFVVFYSHVGLAQSEALAFALLFRFFQMVCSSVGGLLILKSSAYSKLKDVA